MHVYTRMHVNAHMQKHTCTLLVFCDNGFLCSPQCPQFQYPEQYPEEERYPRPGEPFREGDGHRFPPPPWMRTQFDDFPERRPFPPPPPDRFLREPWDLPPRGPWREVERFGDPYGDPYYERDRYVSMLSHEPVYPLTVKNQSQ